MFTLKLPYTQDRRPQLNNTTRFLRRVVVLRLCCKRCNIVGVVGDAVDEEVVGDAVDEEVIFSLGKSCATFWRMEEVDEIDADGDMRICGECLCHEPGS
ncbi:hypothetical protein [Parasitella parasitica]|uniref:Uncharacterized protein n=1 Tax=Parasitella parasitica TaxID=35722 RepID=A0A0B7N741_9FUNG|nr:hypothetical protein [Parasitella parasitica]